MTQIVFQYFDTNLCGHMPATCNNLKKNKLSCFHDLLANCKELWTSFFAIILNLSRYLNCSPVAAPHFSVNFHNRKLFHVSKINSRENWSMSLQIVSVDRWRRRRERTFRNVIWIFKYFHIFCLDSWGCSEGKIFGEVSKSFGATGTMWQLATLCGINHKINCSEWTFRVSFFKISKLSKTFHRN